MKRPRFSEKVIVTGIESGIWYGIESGHWCGLEYKKVHYVKSDGSEDTAFVLHLFDVLNGSVIRLKKLQKAENELFEELKKLD